jgi:hypothetical protein
MSKVQEKEYEGSSDASGLMISRMPVSPANSNVTLLTGCTFLKSE